jgi:hypothetical protein
MSGKPAARKTDMTAYGGPIIEGADSVLIGSQGGIACSSCPGGTTVGSPVNPQLGAKVGIPEQRDRPFRPIVTDDSGLPRNQTTAMAVRMARWIAPCRTLKVRQHAGSNTLEARVLL